VAATAGYLGPPGTFGEQAALLYAPGARLVSFLTHTHVVKGVAGGAVDEGIVAIENSLEGSVSESLDAILQHDDVSISRELVLPVEHNLIAGRDTPLDAVEVVMSHPQALAQCRAYLEEHLPGVRFDAALSTAAAVEEAVRTPGAAAIGTRRAAELFDGRILAEGIQDGAHNKTRFVVVARGDTPPTGDDKTSIAFTVAHDRPGTLLGVLGELSARDLNMTRVESRPSREDLGIYIFLIDFQGHRTDPIVADALAAVRSKAHYFRLLGSYPRFVEEP
jgi:prephenate dehydratase